MYFRDKCRLVAVFSTITCTIVAVSCWIVAVSCCASQLLSNARAQLCCVVCRHQPSVLNTLLVRLSTVSLSLSLFLFCFPTRNAQVKVLDVLFVARSRRAAAPLSANDDDNDDDDERETAAAAAAATTTTTTTTPNKGDALEPV